MLSLHDIQTSYGFKQGKWIVNGEVLETDKGLKRLVYWSNEKLARWHIQWRDRLSEKTGCLTNRMIQTTYGERMLITESGWVTLHDEVSSLFSYRNLEVELGAFLGKYYSVKMDDFEVDITEAIFNEKNITCLKRPITDSVFLEKLRKESLLRYSKAKRMIESNNKIHEYVPIVAPLHSLDQGKVVFEKLYWSNVNSNPERGYGSLKKVLSEWLQRYGQPSFFSMLNELDQHFSLKTNHGGKLLADCLLPWEFIDYMERVAIVKEQEERAVLKEELTFQWETSRALVKALSEWLDVAREKVPV